MCSATKTQAFAKTTENAVREMDQHKGAHLPTEGTVRGLIVYIQSKDDVLQNPSWVNGEMPTWSEELEKEMEDYFLYFSDGKLDIQLDTYPELLVMARTEWDYINSGITYGMALRDIISRVDVTVDFGQYDLWSTIDRSYKIVHGADGTVDLIMIIHRSVGVQGWMPYTGISDLMYGGYQYVDGGTRSIYSGSGYNNDAGSSGLIVTGCPGLSYVLDYGKARTVLVHEMGHKFFGANHPADSFGGLGLMSGNANGLGMCAAEQHIVGMMTLKTIPYNADTIVTLTDYITNDDAIAIPIEAAPRYYYTVEFRALQSKYDNAPEKGVYIYQVCDSWSLSDKKITVITADGQWQWKVNSETGELEHDYPDALSGYNPLQKIVINGAPYWNPDYIGYPGIAFTPQRSPFGAYRNPTSSFILANDTINPNLTVTVLSMNDSAATVYISHALPSIVSTDTPEERGFVLGAAYPNPASGAESVTIPYVLEQTTDIHLTLYSMLGQKIIQQSWKDVAPGTRALTIQMTNVPAGTYVYEVRTNTGSCHHTLIVTQ